MKIVEIKNRQTLNGFDLFFENKALIKSKIEEGLSLIDNDKLREASGHIFSAGGKMLRSSLLAITYKAVGGRDVERILTMAAAIEIVHNWSLVHDDIIDKSKLRRGVPTVHEHWDCDTAILSGDVLNNLAYLLMARSDCNAAKIKKVIECIAETSLALIDGEMMDIEFETRNDVTEEDYFEMIRKKTGALIKSAAKIGAILGTENQSRIKAIEIYGERIGLAFQIKDDLLDLTAEEDTGKGFAGDIREGKKTLLLLHALHHATLGESKRLADIISGKPVTGKAIHQAIDIMCQAGSLEYAQKIIAELIQEARQSLTILPGSQYVNALSEMAGFIATRKF